MNEYLNMPAFRPSRIQGPKPALLSDKTKDRLAALAVIGLFAAMGVMLAWRG